MVGRSCRTRGPSAGPHRRCQVVLPPAPAFESLNSRADALYVVNDALVVTNRNRINTWALAARLPTMHGTREVVEAGGVISMDRLPRPVRARGQLSGQDSAGAMPGDIPVERPTKFDLVVNLTTAKAHDLTIPESFLLRTRGHRLGADVCLWPIPEVPPPLNNVRNRG